MNVEENHQQNVYYASNHSQIEETTQTLGKIILLHFFKTIISFNFSFGFVCADC